MKKLYYLVLALLSLSACTGAPLSLEGTKWEVNEIEDDEEYTHALYFVSSNEVWIGVYLNEEYLDRFHKNFRDVGENLSYEYKTPVVSFYDVEDHDYEGEGTITGNKMTVEGLFKNEVKVFTKK